MWPVSSVSLTSSCSASSSMWQLMVPVFTTCSPPPECRGGGRGWRGTRGCGAPSPSPRYYSARVLLRAAETGGCFIAQESLTGGRAAYRGSVAELVAGALGGISSYPHTAGHSYGYGPNLWLMNFGITLLKFYMSVVAIVAVSCPYTHHPCSLPSEPTVHLMRVTQQLRPDNNRQMQGWEPLVQHCSTAHITAQLTLVS